MILINLLPHREFARKKRKELFIISAGGIAFGGGFLAFITSLWLQHAIYTQMMRNDFLNQEIEKLNTQIKDIASLRVEIQGLKARQIAVENLQSDRNTPVHLFNELASQIPKGIYLNQIKQDAQSVLIIGFAQSQDRVSDLLRNFSSSQSIFSKPELIEINSTSQQFATHNQRRLFNFTIKLQLLRIGEKKISTLISNQNNSSH